MIVIDYKSDAHHDPMLNDDLIYALGLATPEELDQIKAMALATNELLSKYLDLRGITLVDFKMEFGKYNGEIVLGDEISMDSMRLWDKETGTSLDKDVYRFGKGGRHGDLRRRREADPLPPTLGGRARMRRIAAATTAGGAADRPRRGVRTAESRRPGRVPALRRTRQRDSRELPERAG